MLLLSLNRRIFNPNDTFKSLNLVPSHAKVLFYLIHNGAHPISKVAKDLSISKPNMTPIIDKLVNEGYVERYCDDNDRRVILIKHTKSACNLFKSLEEQVKINIYNKIKNLNEDELNMLSESIDNILKLIPKNESIKFCHRLVQFGRDFCKAKNPNCKNCPLTQFCENIFN